MAGCNETQFHLTTMTTAITVILLMLSKAAEAHLKSLCSQTAYPSLCQPLVKGSSPIEATDCTIGALKAKTKLAIADAARHKNGNNQVTICHATLMNAAFNLGNAKRSIMNRNVMSLKMFLTAAVSDYGVCVDGFIESHQVNTVQHAVDELRKMATNCLSLATLIR